MQGIARVPFHDSIRFVKGAATYRLCTSPETRAFKSLAPDLAIQLDA